MKLKEFLKPNKRKIIITAIIVLLYILPTRFFVSIIKAECKPCPDYWPDNCPDGNYGYYLIIPKICACCISSSEIINDYLWNLIMPLIISYILSCFISLIFKVKKK